jgi:hypothetical protein
MRKFGRPCRGRFVRAQGHNRPFSFANRPRNQNRHFRRGATFDVLGIFGTDCLTLGWGLPVPERDLKTEIVAAVIGGRLAWSLLEELARRLPHHHPDAVRRAAQGGNALGANGGRAAPG